MSGKNVLNLKNTNFRSGFYPSFLGEDLGLNDTIHITYPDIKEMMSLQRSQFWTEKEIDLSKDRNDLMECDRSQREVMLKNLIAQWGIDACASRGILQTFGDFISNTEVQELLAIQTYMEHIHAAQYSEIVRVCYENPTEAMEEALSNAEIVYRTEVIGEVFNETYRLGGELRLGKLDLKNPKHLRRAQIQLLKNLAVLYGLEAISFMASFACTFALTSTGKFQGIDKAVGLICRDEILHAEGDRLLFRAFKSEVGQDIFDEAKPDMQIIFDRLVAQELRWSEYIFEEGRNVLGLTEKVLKEYVYYCAKPCFDYLGLEWKYPVVEKQPLAYMQKYIDPDSVTVAPQELEISNYRVATVSSEMPDDFDF